MPYSSRWRGARAGYSPADGAARDGRAPRPDALRPRRKIAKSTVPCGYQLLLRQLGPAARPRGQSLNYGPESLFDNNPNTAWVEGVDGQGIGEWIVIEFDRLRLVTDLQIQNGYNKGRELYQKKQPGKGAESRVFRGGKRTVVVKDTG